MASTMAFSTLTLARLFHGFNCRGKQFIFKMGFTTNPYSIYAFAAGVCIPWTGYFYSGIAWTVPDTDYACNSYDPGGSAGFYPYSHYPVKT